jgi:hypothetical protein
VVGPRKYLSTNAARVRFYSCVQSHVSGEHVTASEGPLANVAQVRLGGRLPGVLAALVPRRHVLGQPIVQTEHLTADGAHVRHVRTGRHLLDDRRHLQVVPGSDGFLRGGRGDVAFDDGHGDGTAAGHEARREERKRRRHQTVEAGRVRLGALHRQIQGRVLRGGRLRVDGAPGEREGVRPGGLGPVRFRRLEPEGQVGVGVAPSAEDVGEVLGVEVPLERARRGRRRRQR